MNINFLSKPSLSFVFFKERVFNHFGVSEKMTAAVLTAFTSLVSLSLVGFCGLALYKFVAVKISNANAFKALQEFHKSLEEWKNDPKVKGDKEEACKRILEAFDKKSKFLDLQHLKLSSIPDAVSNLNHMESLALIDNQLESLPEVISKLTQLKNLYLHKNMLKSLPEVIGNLTQLRKIYLSNNCLKSLPETIGRCIHLEELYLDENKLESLPKTIGNLTKLKILRLVDNQLQDLPQTIGNLIQLQDLRLHSNQLKDLPQSMINLKSLTILGLLKNPNLPTLPIGLSSLSQICWI